MLVGWSPPRLKRIPGISAYDFTKLGNVIELASVWVSREEFIRTPKIKLYGRGKKGAGFSINELWTLLAARGSRIQDLTKLLRDLVAHASWGGHLGLAREAIPRGRALMGLVVKVCSQ